MQINCGPEHHQLEEALCEFLGLDFAGPTIPHTNVSTVYERTHQT